MSQGTLNLPTYLKANDTFLNSSKLATYTVTIRATDDTDTYTLLLPKQNNVGFWYNPPTGYATEWQFSSPYGEFEESVFRLSSFVTPSKQMAFNVDAVSAGTIRTITMPDTDILLTDVYKLRNLDTAEISQLENINLSTIGPLGWARFSASDQLLTTTSDVIFGSLRMASIFTGPGFVAGTLDNLLRSQMWLYGSNDADPANAALSYSGRGPILRVGATQALADIENLIGEGLVVYGMATNSAPMDVPDYSTAAAKPNGFRMTDTISNTTTPIFVANGSLLSWCHSGGLTNDFQVTSASAVSPTLKTEIVRINTSPAAPEIVLTVAPSATYTIPLPVAPVTRTSYFQTTGTTSTWVEQTLQATMIHLYLYPTSYTVTGGGSALKLSILAHGGGTPLSPVVYEIDDSLIYTAGIDITNMSNIVIRGAVGQRPIIATNGTFTSGIMINYNGILHGTTTNVTIGNITFDVTGPGIGITQTAILINRGITAFLTDTVGSIYIKDVLITNTDYSSLVTSRGGIVAMDNRAGPNFWVSSIQVEDCIIRDTTAQDNSGALMLMGVESYEGLRNAFLYPNLTTYGIDVARNYYWLRGSNAVEQYSYFSHGAYSGDTAARRYMVKISQEGLISSYMSVCAVTFDHCVFSNAVELTNGAIILSHVPTSGTIQPISLTVDSCTFLDNVGSGIFLTSDSLNHGNLLTLHVTNNIFKTCTTGITQSSTYVSGYANLVIEKNKYDRCGATDNGFTATIQDYRSVDLQAYAMIYKYRNLADYSVWGASSSDYFISTTAYPPGFWHVVTFTDGLPSTGWDVAISNRITANTATGMLTVLEDGFYVVSYSIAATIAGAVTTKILESYCLIDGETPPVTSPAGPQKYKIATMPQYSLALNEIMSYNAKLNMFLRRGQTLQLAIRWVVGPVGTAVFYIQSATLSATKKSY